MDLNIWLILAQVINFGILFFIFKHFLGEKLLILINERKENLHKLGNVDADVKGKMDEAYEKATNMIEEAKAKILELEKNAEMLVKRTKEKVIADAALEAKSILSGARDDIEKEKLSMMNSMKSKIIDLSLKINSKIFDNSDSNKEFIQKEVNSIKL